MTIDQINAAIAKLKELREKVYALESGKYFELDLSDDQAKKFNDQVDILKGELKSSAALVEIGVPIEVKPVEELPVDMKPENLPKPKPIKG